MEDEDEDEDEGNWIDSGDKMTFWCDYKLCDMFSFCCIRSVIWRGHFNGTGNEKSANLGIRGTGMQNSSCVQPPLFSNFAASVWIKDVFVKATQGIHVLILTVHRIRMTHYFNSTPLHSPTWVRQSGS